MSANAQKVSAFIKLVTEIEYTKCKKVKSVKKKKLSKGILYIL